VQGRRQNNFHEEPKKKRPKNSHYKASSRGGPTEKRSKNIKKETKIALLSLFLLYLYHAWKSIGGTVFPLPSAADAHAYVQNMS